MNTRLSLYFDYLLCDSSLKRGAGRSSDFRTILGIEKWNLCRYCPRYPVIHSTWAIN